MTFDSILLVASNGKEQMKMKDILSKHRINGEITFCFSAGDAIRKTSEKEFDIILIKYPLPDVKGVDFVKILANKVLGPIILFMNSPLLSVFGTRFTGYGVFIIGLPLDDLMFSQCVSLGYSSNRKIKGMSSEISKLRRKLDDIKKINQAKFLLMEHKKFTEEEAHKYIEKTAMSQRKSKNEVVQRILNDYEESMEEI